MRLHTSYFCYVSFICDHHVTRNAPVDGARISKSGQVNRARYADWAVELGLDKLWVNEVTSSALVQRSWGPKDLLGGTGHFMK